MINHTYFLLSVTIVGKRLARYIRVVAMNRDRSVYENIDHSSAKGDGSLFTNPIFDEHDEVRALLSRTKRPWLLLVGKEQGRFGSLSGIATTEERWTITLRRSGHQYLQYGWSHYAVRDLSVDLYRHLLDLSDVFRGSILCLSNITVGCQHRHRDSAVVHVWSISRESAAGDHFWPSNQSRADVDERVCLGYYNGIIRDLYTHECRVHDDSTTALQVSHQSFYGNLIHTRHAASGSLTSWDSEEIPHLTCIDGLANKCYGLFVDTYTRWRRRETRLNPFFLEDLASEVLLADGVPTVSVVLASWLHLSVTIFIFCGMSDFT